MKREGVQSTLLYLDKPTLDGPALMQINGGDAANAECRCIGDFLGFSRKIALRRRRPR